MPYDSDKNWLGAFTGEEVDATLKRREEHKATERWLVDPIFPAGAMHLIGGASGSMKTTWLLQQLWEWEQGLPLFGKYKSNPCPWVYITNDRSSRDTNRTLQRLGYHKWGFVEHAIEDLLPSIKVPGMNDIEMIGKVPDFWQHIFPKFPWAELFVIEGLSSLLPDIDKGRSQNKQEQIWGINIRKYLGPTNKTIIATTHSPKVQAASGMSTDDRSKFLGSQALIGGCSTMVFIEKDPKTDKRAVKIMGRNFSDINATYTPDTTSGKLILECSSGKDGNTYYETDDDRELAIIGYAQSVSQFTIPEMVKALTKLDISRSTARRVCLKLAMDGVLEVRQEGGETAPLTFLYKPVTM